jgi:ABC-type transporter Mla subunit MlaD
MPDEVVDALKEIAALLRRRVEQTDEQVKRAEVQLAAISANRPEQAAVVKQMKENAEQARRSYGDIDKARAEEKAFRDRLLATLDQLNASLAQAIKHFEKA